MKFENNGQEYEFYNSAEEPVFEKVRAAMDSTDMCKCNKCYYDACALVLNNLGSPHYVTSQYGALMTKASFLSVDILGNLYVEIYKAIDLVKNNPQH